MADISKEIYEKMHASGIIEEARESRLASFDKLAEGYGMRREELVELFLPAMKKSLGETLAYYEKHNIDPLHKQLLEGVKDPDDYWAYVDRQEEYKRAKTIDAFCESYQEGIPVNKAYVERMALNLPTPVTQLDTLEDYQHLLSQIPMIFTYKLDFNAFVSAEGPIRDVPYIGLHYILLTVLDNFIVHTLSMVFAIDPQKPHVFKIRPGEDVIADSKTPLNTAVILSCVDMLLGKSPVLLAAKRDPLVDGQFYYSSVPTVINFVLFHEYGHILLGHLEQERSPQMEFHADVFAMLYTLNLLRSKKGNSYMILFSLAALYILLYIAEASRHTIDPNYPPTMDRVLAVLEPLSNEHKQQFTGLWNHIIYAVNEPLQLRQIEIPFIEYQEPS